MKNKAIILKDEKAVCLESLDFLREREGYGYFERHFLYFNHKKTLRKCEGFTVFVPTAEVASDVHKYYRVPKDKIAVAPERFTF